MAKITVEFNDELKKLLDRTAKQKTEPKPKSKEGRHMEALLLYLKSEDDRKNHPPLIPANRRIVWLVQEPTPTP